MRKRISLIILAAIILIVMIIPSSKIYAVTTKNIETLNATQANGKIKVSGTTENGVLAVAVQVLDEDENLVALETGAVDNDNKYEVEIEAKEGKYIIKVADYDGGEYKTVTIPEDAEETTEETKEKATKEDTTTNVANTAKTGDSIIVYVTIFAVAAVSYVVIKKAKKVKASKRN